MTIWWHNHSLFPFAVVIVSLSHPFAPLDSRKLTPFMIQQCLSHTDDASHPNLYLPFPHFFAGKISSAYCPALHSSFAKLTRFRQFKLSVLIFNYWSLNQFASVRSTIVFVVQLERVTPFYYLTSHMNSKSGGCSLVMVRLRIEFPTKIIIWTGPWTKDMTA